MRHDLPSPDSRLMGFFDSKWIGRVRAGRRDHALLWDSAAALAQVGAFECDLDDENLRWTDGVFALFGVERDVLLDRRDIVTLYDEESRETLHRLRSHAIATRGSFQMEARIVRPDGETRWLRIHAAVRCEAGRAIQLYGMKQDISADRARLDEMRRLAELDGLTGLPGRMPFQRDFLDAPLGHEMRAHIGALVLVDVDGFKQVNDLHGHDAGDACLKAVAARLSAAFPDARLIARIGGDEFALLLDRVSVASDRLESRLSAALHAIARPVAWRGDAMTFSASAGIAYTDNEADDATILFASADAALYAAKRGGRNTYRVRQRVA
jgi:diguanylate cyclase (GGDEF)-like protein/PAS domain S-box-containing protein